uniref:N-acyl-aliphatic-L-amino acid amidohydrolase n=1 Tax=Arcella intermedia TaxID=1963864 RepID=A0A6B2L5A2_9EUKA
MRIRSVTAEGPNGSYDQAVQFLRTYGKEVGLTQSQVFFPMDKQPILILTWKGQDPSLPSILLNGHYDVVPADSSKWTFDPWGGVRAPNGNIYGRGAQDMKCVLVQYLEAVGRLMREVKEGRLRPPLRTIHLSFLPDEETGGLLAAVPFVNSEVFRSLNVGVTLDEGLANPNDAYSIFYGERAVWWVKIKAEGSTGHGSRFIQRAAIEKLSEVLQKVYLFRAEQEKKLHGHPEEVGCAHAKAKKLGDVVTMNVTAIRAHVPGPANFDGFAVNCIPTEAIAAMDVRIPPTVTIKEMEDLLSSWTKEEGLSYHFYNKVERHNISSIKEDDLWWSTIQGTFAQLNKKIEPEIFPAGTDSRHFRNCQVPCYGFSPINKTPILLHDHDEFLNERTLIEGVQVYQKLIYQLANCLPPKAKL